MRKVILSFEGLGSREEIQEYIAKQMEFPCYYGKNLDALYDCLTDIMEPTAIGCYFPKNGILWGEDVLEEGQGSGLKEYLGRLRDTFADAEEDNHNLAIFFG